MAKKSSDKNNAFTLAEVLITLTIIGVIAAITIPNLIKKYNDYITLTKIKKVQSILSNITAELLKEYDATPITRYQLGCLDGNDCDNGFATKTVKNPQEITDFIFSKLKIKYYCGYNTKTQENKCTVGTEQVKSLNGVSPVNFPGVKYPQYHYIALTEDGMSYALRFNDWPILELPNNYGANPKGRVPKGYVMVLVDINGKKKPNTIGKDIFVFSINSMGVFPAGINSNNDNDCNKMAIGRTCAGIILNNGKIPY